MKTPKMTPLMESLMERVQEADEKALHGLTDHHLRTIGAYVRVYTGCWPDMAIDFGASPPTIYVTPQKYGKIPMSRLEWAWFWLRRKFQKMDRKLLIFMGIPNWRIVFRRK